MSQQPPPNAGFPPPPPSSRRNSRRLIIGAIGGVIILVVVIGFAALHGGHSPKDVVTTYLDAYESRDCSKARDQLTLALQEQFGTCDQDEGNYVLASGDTMTYSSVKVTNQTDSAATAQSTVTVNGQPQAITFALVKENGDWKISSAG